MDSKSGPGPCITNLTFSVTVVTMKTIKNWVFSVVQAYKWHANSPDLNQLDYLFGMKERNALRALDALVTSIKDKIRKIWSKEWFKNPSIEVSSSCGFLVRWWYASHASYCILHLNPCLCN